MNGRLQCLIGLALVLLGPGSAWAQEASAEGGGGGGGSGYPSRGLGVMSDLVVTGEGVGTIGGVLYDAGRFRFGGGLGLTAIEIRRPPSPLAAKVISSCTAAGTPTSAWAGA